jgi:D-glucosaminate-6-phosphate ammonia-lyase
VQAAWVNCSPHHGLNRTMKVGKEEIMGLLAAVETFFEKRNYHQEVALWDSWLSTISERVSKVPGIRTELLPPPGVNPHPILNVEWDPEKIPITADELHQLLLEGEPRLMTHAEGEGHSFPVRAAGMKPGDDRIVAERLYAAFIEAGKRTKRPLAEVEIHFYSGSASHSFRLETAGNRVEGIHAGEFRKGKIHGTVESTRVTLRSKLPFDNTQLPYLFTGRLEGQRMSGDVDLDEHGIAQWTAVRRA